MHHLRLAPCVLALVLLTGLGGSAAPTRSASVLLTWRIDAPQAQSADVQSVEAGLVAINFIVPMLDALARHPSAKMTLALDPAFIRSLQQAAAGDDAFATLASGTIGADDTRSAELRNVLATSVVPVAELRTTKAAGRFVTSAVAARLALMGSSPKQFAHASDIDYAGNALLLSLIGSGYAHDRAALLTAKSLSPRDLDALSKEFAAACHEVIERLQTSARNGTVELAALPAYEPILPLIIDSAGRNQRVPFTVAISASADAAEAVDEGMREVLGLDPNAGNPGVFSPSGAYDDETAALLQTRGARYGIFSERVVKVNVGAAASAVAAAQGAAFQAYLMETSKTQTIPILFCSDTASAAIDSQPLASPSSAMADRLRTIVVNALSVPNLMHPVITLCLPATGSILHRANRAAALDALAAALSGGLMHGTTPRDFLGAHPPAADTYGYEAASEAGDFNLWMGSQNQMSLWNALVGAREAAGGDTAIGSAQVRDPLLQAESGRWFLTLMLAQPRYLTNASLDRFRALIAQIYRAASKPVPSDIAPVKFNTAAPPSPSAQPAASNSPVPAPSPTTTAAKPGPSPLPSASRM